MEIERLRRNELLIEIVNRKQKSNLYKLKLSFNIWSKETKLAKMNESATKIQICLEIIYLKKKVKIWHVKIIGKYKKNENNFQQKVFQ